MFLFKGQHKQFQKLFVDKNSAWIEAWIDIIAYDTYVN